MMGKRVVKSPMNGRRSWSVRLWARYLLAAKSPVEARRRLELARSEARPEMLPELETAAAGRIADLETAGVVAVVQSPDALELPAIAERELLDSDGAEHSFGAWWWK